MSVEIKRKEGSRLFEVYDRTGRLIGEWPEVARGDYEENYCFVRDENGKASVVDELGDIRELSSFDSNMALYSSALQGIGPRTFAVKKQDGGYEINMFTSEENEVGKRIPSLSCVGRVRDIVVEHEPYSVLRDEFIYQSENEKWYVATVEKSPYISLFDLKKKSEGYISSKDAQKDLDARIKERRDRQDTAYSIANKQGPDVAIQKCLNYEIDIADLPDICFDGRYFDMLREGLKRNFDSNMKQGQSHGLTVGELNDIKEQAQIDSDYIRMRAEKVRVKSDKAIQSAEEMDLF